MDLGQLIYILKKRIILIICITLFAGAIGGVYSTLFTPKMYISDISVIIGKNYLNLAEGESSVSTYSDILMYQKAVKTYGKIATTRIVASDIIDKLELNYSPTSLLGAFSVVTTTDTEFMTLRVKLENPEEAAQIANQWAVSLKEISKEIQGTDNVKILDTALVPKSPSSPNVKVNVVTALSAGFIVALGLCCLVEYMNTTIKSEDDVLKLVNLSILSSIPNFEMEE